MRHPLELGVLGFGEETALGQCVVADVRVSEHRGATSVERAELRALTEALSGGVVLAGQRFELVLWEWGVAHACLRSGPSMMTCVNREAAGGPMTSASGETFDVMNTESFES